MENKRGRGLTYAIGATSTLIFALGIGTFPSSESVEQVGPGRRILLMDEIRPWGIVGSAAMAMLALACAAGIWFYYRRNLSSSKWVFAAAGLVGLVPYVIPGMVSLLAAGLVAREAREMQ